MLLLLLPSLCPSLVAPASFQKAAYFLSLLGVGLPLLKLVYEVRVVGRVGQQLLTGMTDRGCFLQLTLTLTLQALFAPCGTYVFMCIDGKARKNPCDRRARLWFFRLLLGLGRRLAGCCCACGGGGAGGAIAGMATGGAIAGMANGTGVADAGVSYASVEEVENSNHAAHGISNVYAAKKYGQRWRKKAALNQRESPRGSNDGSETDGQAWKQSRVPSPNQISKGTRIKECKVHSELSVSLDKEPKIFPL